MKLFRKKLEVHRRGYPSFSCLRECYQVGQLHCQSKPRPRVECFLLPLRSNNQWYRPHLPQIQLYLQLLLPPILLHHKFHPRWHQRTWFELSTHQRNHPTHTDQQLVKQLVPNTLDARGSRGSRPSFCPFCPKSC